MRFTATFAALVATILALALLVNGHEEQQQRRDLQPTPTKVVIVGAGAAGLTAAATLEKHGGFDYKILEASNEIGGRVKKDGSFVDFPVDLGGTFMEEDGLLEEIKGESVNVQTFRLPRAGEGYAWGLYRFIDYTWYDFFADHIAPSDPNRIEFGCDVHAIIYFNPVNDRRVYCKGNANAFIADYVIVTVPLSVLKRGDIWFFPNLPDSVMGHPADFVPGLKIVMEFADTFYPEYFSWSRDRNSFVDVAGDYEIRNGALVSENLFWDYSTFQSSSRSVLSAYIIGEDYEPFRGLNEIQVVNTLLGWLDASFNDQATLTFLNYTMVDWTNDPLAEGTYTNQDPNNCCNGAQNVNNRIFLAGEAFPTDGWQHGWVHTAAFSGRDAAEKIILLL